LSITINSPVFSNRAGIKKGIEHLSNPLFVYTCNKHYSFAFLGFAGAFLVFFSVAFASAFGASAAAGASASA